MAKITALFSRFLGFLKRRWKLVLILLIILGIASFVLYRRSQAQNKPQTFVKPENRDLAKTVEVSGVLDADEKATLRFAAGGKVTYIGAAEGETVKKGELLAQIDQRELQKRLQQDLNNYANERLDWDQTLETNKDKALTNTDTRNQQSDQLDLNNTILNVEIRDIAIRETRLFSPIAGVLVTRPSTTAGVSLLATDIFEVINPASLVFKAAVDEADIALVKPGQMATIELDAYPDEPIKTTVSFIAPKSQQSTTGTVFLVKMPVPGDSTLSKYRLGMNGDVTITLETRNNVLTIPIDATRQRDDKVYVDVKSGETTVEKEVELGLETDEYVQVLSGLTPNDEVLMPEAEK